MLSEYDAMQLAISKLVSGATTQDDEGFADTELAEVDALRNTNVFEPDAV